MKDCPDLGFENVVSTPTICWVFKVLSWEEWNQIFLFLFPTLPSTNKIDQMTLVLQLPIKLLTTILSLKGAELPLRERVKYH